MGEAYQIRDKEIERKVKIKLIIETFVRDSKWPLKLTKII